MKPESLLRRVLAGLFDIGPPTVLDLRPPATAGYSITRRALAGVLGVTLPERTGGDVAALSGVELVTDAPAPDERSWLARDWWVLGSLALVALLPVMTVLVFGHVTVDTMVVGALLIAIVGVVMIARFLVIFLQARDREALHRQAGRMTAEQITLRSSVNALFVNLSRRSQALVERQLTLLDRLEQDEQDPDQLASLFELDHLATRMRRNSENLLVLSGTGLPRQMASPASASDVIGAAVSEIEEYTRVHMGSAPDLAVHAHAVTDLVHLIAELLDNATSFSTPDRPVVVRAATTREKGVAIQITDQGVGMTEEEIAEANVRLADPPGLDIAVTRRMGLYVVAHLAKRHDIVVRLRHNDDIGGGLIARVNVPAELVLPMTKEQRPRPPAPDHEPTTPSFKREREPATRLPVYGDVLSAWYAATADAWGNAPDEVAFAPAPAPPEDDTQHASTGEIEVAAPMAWTSSDDSGWFAAKALLDSTSPETTTKEGLPKRGPRNLPPDTVTPLPATQETASGNDEGTPRPPRSPEAVRDRMSSFQRGVERGRHTSETHVEEARTDESARDHR